MSYNLSDALETARLRGPSWAPIVEDERRTTVVTLDDTASRIAGEIRSQGLAPGARIGLRVHNSAPHIAAMFGVWRAGGTLVPLNPRLTSGEESGLCSHARISARLEIDARSGATALEPLPGSSEPSAPEGARGALDAGDLAAIAYTSGTTGRPKGVMLSHANLLWAAAAVMQTRRDQPTSVAAVVSPLCHLPIFVSHYLARLLSGGAVVLGAYDPERVIRMIRDQGVTDLPLVPAMIGALLESPGLGAANHLTKVTVGSAFTAMEVKRALAERFPRAEIIEAYGQTESTDGLTMTVARDALERPGTVGRAHALFALAIRASDGRMLEAGQTGEILARGPIVMQGYLDDQEATNATLRNGWLHTGDLGRLDHDGYLYITGRLKEIIITGGENVSPEEVETVLGRHPAVAEVAVFGMPHPRWGEQVTAAVVARGPLSLDDLVDHARPHLARFKLPRELVLVDQLPKTNAGKVKRAELRERLQREREATPSAAR